MPGQVKTGPSASSAVPGPTTVPGFIPERQKTPPNTSEARRGEFPVTKARRGGVSRNNGAPASPLAS